MHSATPNQFNAVAEIYDSLMSVVPYRWWVEYVERLWARYGFAPERVLDLACGTGNVTRELRKRGYEVEGTDYSASMLEVARRNLGPETPLWCQNMKDLALPSPPFDACVSLFDSLNYLLTHSELEQALAAVHRHLVPEGCFVFDMNAIRALETGMFDQSGTGRDDSLEYEWHSAWEPVSRLCTIQMEFRVRDGARERVFHETHVQKGYTQHEITTGLERAGFRVLGVYDAFTMNPPTARTDRLYFVARA